MKKGHEKRVCNTVARFIAERKQITINNISYPDKKEHNLPSVDVLIESPSLEIVMEHTQIESYSKQIEDNKRIWKLLKPVQTALTGKLPTPGHYELSIDIGAVKGAKDTKCIQNALIKWIEEEASLLREGSPDVAPDHYIKAKPTGVPFEVTLCRWPGNDGNFFLALNAPKDLEEKRRERIREALEKKCPKLAKARGDERVSILLLELNDISLGSYINIAEAVAQELRSCDDEPGEIYLVRTELERWEVWVLKEGANVFRDVKNYGPHYLDPVPE